MSRQDIFTHGNLFYRLVVIPFEWFPERALSAKISFKKFFWKQKRGSDISILDIFVVLHFFFSYSLYAFRVCQDTGTARLLKIYIQQIY